MNLYSTNYADQAATGFVALLNQFVSAVAVSNGATIADAFGAFAAAAGTQSPCEAGLLIPLSGGTCDVHPTLEGQEVLAQSVLDAL